MRRRALTNLIAPSPARACAVAVACTLATTATDLPAHGEPKAAQGRPGAEIQAPGYRTLAFPAPRAGTYALPPLGAAGDGDVVDGDGKQHRLHELLGDRVAVLSFIYTSCQEQAGCPLASFVLGRVAHEIDAAPALRDRVRLLTLSFDPSHDSPAVMRSYGERIHRGGGDWRFLTTTSPAELAPILEAYDQAVSTDYDEAGEPLGSISHILRVFLIDRQARIRNIYTASFLHADTVLSDIRTVLLEEPDETASDVRAVPSGTRAVATTDAPGSASAAPPDDDATPRLHGAGDDKNGYQGRGYRTRSRSLPTRRGEHADLLEIARRPPLGLPPLVLLDGETITREKIALGRKLFYDRRLSHNDTVSCALCHVPEQGFTSNEMTTPVGIEGRSVRRNAPTLYNVAYVSRLFHDGREDRLEQQIWGPLLAASEMGNPSVGHVLGKIRTLADYAGLFEAAFDGRGPTMETLGAALASYQRTLLSAASRFDRWRFGGEDGALDDAGKRGFELFTGKARCDTCHLIDDELALFTDGELHNTGIGYAHSTYATPAKLTVQVAPGTFVEVDADVLAGATEPVAPDLGRYEITQDPDDRWKYRTPTLRNVALTSPYMHDGSLGTLRDVVEFYDRGGVANQLLDPMIAPLGLSDGQIADLVAFLEALTGDNVDVLVADAFAAPVGDRR